MFCSQCGAQNNDTASFCAKCGAPIKKPAQAQVPPPQQTYFDPNQQYRQYGQQPYGQPAQTSGSMSELINDLKASFSVPGGFPAFILSRFNVIVLAGAVFMFIGLFPNFMEYSGYGLTIGAALIKGGDGVIVLLSTLVCICAGLIGMHKMTLGCAALNLLVIMIDMADAPSSISVGAGFVLILLGGLATIAGSVMGIIYAKQGKKLPLQK